MDLNQASVVGLIVINMYLELHGLIVIIEPC